MATSEHYRPFEALEVLLKDLGTSSSLLGPSHDLSQQLRYNIGLVITSNQKSACKWDPNQLFCSVDRYEEDCGVYIENLEEMGWDLSDIVLKRGALVKCVNLVKASHLNVERAWTQDYDEESWRHVVQFEDKRYEIVSCEA